MKTLLRERELRKASWPAEIQGTPPDERRRRKELVGVVTSAKMQKTIVVKVTRRFQHSLYQRYVRVSEEVLRP